MRRLSQNPEFTKAELRALNLVEDCYINSEITNVMGIALDTVKQYCSHIYSKLDVKNRQQAIKVAVELGIINFNIY